MLFYEVLYCKELNDKRLSEQHPHRNSQHSLSSLKRLHCLCSASFEFALFLTPKGSSKTCNSTFRLFFFYCSLTELVLRIIQMALLEDLAAQALSGRGVIFLLTVIKGYKRTVVWKALKWRELGCALCKLLTSGTWTLI